MKGLMTMILMQENIQNICNLREEENVQMTFQKYKFKDDKWPALLMLKRKISAQLWIL
jgi:hypothetical protein